MLNIIKMDVYRMLHSRSTYYVLIGLSFFLFFLVSNTHKALLDLQQGIPVAEAIVGIGFDATLLSDKMSLLQFFKVIAGSQSFILMLSVFSVLFINHEEASGFSKNIAGQVQKRGWLLLSKFICQGLFILLAFIVGIATIIVAGETSYEAIIIGNIGQLFLEIGVQFIFHLAFAGILLVIITLLRQPVISLLVSVLLCFGAFGFLYRAIDGWLQKGMGGTGFTVTNYTMTGIISRVSIDSADSDLIRSLVIAVIYCVVTVGLSVAIKNKRDL